MPEMSTLTTAANLSPLADDATDCQTSTGPELGVQDTPESVDV